MIARETTNLWKKSLTVDQFPSPEYFWDLYRMAEQLDDQKEPTVTQDYVDGSGVYSDIPVILGCRKENTAIFLR